MNIQPKLDRIATLIDQLPDSSQHKNHSPISRDFILMSEDPSLPKALRDFCFDLSMLAGGNPAGPLGNIPKKRIKEVFAAIKVGAY